MSQHVSPDMGQHLVPLFSAVPLLLPMLGLVCIVQSMGSPSGSSIVTHICVRSQQFISVVSFAGLGFVIVGFRFMYGSVVNVYIACVVISHEHGSVAFTYHV